MAFTVISSREELEHLMCQISLGNGYLSKDLFQADEAVWEAVKKLEKIIKRKEKEK